MDTIFLNTEKSITSEPYRLLLNLADNINVKTSDRSVASSNLCISYTWQT